MLMPGSWSLHNEPSSQQSSSPSPSVSGALPVTWSHAAGNSSGGHLVWPSVPAAISKASDRLATGLKALSIVQRASLDWDANVPGSSGTPAPINGRLPPRSVLTRVPLVLSSCRIDGGVTVVVPVCGSNVLTCSQATNRLTPAIPTPLTAPAQPDGIDVAPSLLGA